MKAVENPIPRIRFTDVLRIRDFSVLFGAEVQSIAGDQLARVALSVWVFRATGSSPATAAAYAATLLPAVIGGWALGRIGDHLPRRTVMIGCDVFRAACFAAMALPGVSLSVVIVLLVAAVFVGPAFAASEVSYLADRLSPARFGTATAIRLSSSQMAQVGGFAVGGVLVEILGPQQALLLNAATYLVSALAIATAMRGGRGRSLPPPVYASNTPNSGTPFVGLWRDERLRALVSLGLLVGFFVVPEGLAVPFGDSMDATPAQVGLLLASGALGGAIGAVLLVRWVPVAHRSSVAQWMAVVCGLPLIVTGVSQQLVLSLTCWLISGLFAAYIVQVMTVVVQEIPAERRAHFVGVVAALLLGVQGAGLIVFGAAARVMSPAHAIGTAGAAGSICALILVLGPLSRLSSPPAVEPNFSY